MKKVHIVEEVFIVYRDGRLIAHCYREECKSDDADLLSGMLIAIRGLIQDGLERGGELRSITYGDKLILLVTGEHVILAAVIYGPPDEALDETLTEAVRHIEGFTAGVIEEWTGDLQLLGVIEELVLPIIRSTSHLTREDVKGAMAISEVSVQSAVGFQKGNMRLEVDVVNATEEEMANTALDVTYDHDMLRLESIEPGTLEINDDRVTLGNVMPGEERTVAFWFDPQDCQGSPVDGHISYEDRTGKVHNVEMKRRFSDVVCPIYFTVEHANTAMLRRLIKEELNQNKFRVLRYPKSLTPREVLQSGKLSLDNDEIQLVREYVAEGPPYEAEAWYYTERGEMCYQFVMRLGVVEEKGVLEFFIASKEMELISELLDEFQDRLQRIVEERNATDARMEVEHDEGIRRDLEHRPLLLETMAEEGIETVDWR